MNLIPVSQEAVFLEQVGLTPAEINIFKQALGTTAIELGIAHSDILDWTLYRLSNGGWFYKIETKEKSLSLTSPNGYACQIGIIAASIVINLFTLNSLAQFTADPDKLYYDYTLLKRYILETDGNDKDRLAEAEAVYCLID